MALRSPDPPLRFALEGTTSREGFAATEHRQFLKKKTRLRLLAGPWINSDHPPKVVMCVLTKPHLG